MKDTNIILIMVDQMRGDCLGISGHKDVKTPYLDTLATQGVLFNNAYTACPSCIAARAGLLTGKMPKNHGRVGYAEGVDWNYKNMLASVLTKSGYQTKCVGKMHVHPVRNNCGFEDVDLHDGHVGFHRNQNIPYYEHQSLADDYFHWLKNEKGIDADVTATGIDCNSWIARPWIYDEESHPTNWVVRKSVDFLRKRDRTRPFFLKMSFVRPHPPFDAPQCYFDMYANKELKQPEVGDWADTESIKKAGRIYNGQDGIYDKELLRQAQAGYYACITHLDHQIGRFMHALTEHRLLDNTVILFVSDHGELLGDHNTYRKIRPYQGSAHVPLFIWGNKSLIKNSGVQRDNVAELRDIYATVLDVAGIEPPDDIDGESLLKIAENENAPWREYIHGEHCAGHISNHFIVTKKDKYIWFSNTGIEQYFDLENDPFENVNKIDDNDKKERILYLKNALIKELEDREEGFVENGELIVGKSDRAILESVLGKATKYKLIHF